MQKKSSLTGSLFMWAFFPVAFFCFAAIHKKGEIYWPLIGLVAGLILVITQFRKSSSSLLTLIAFHLVTHAAIFLFIFQSRSISELIKVQRGAFAELLDRPSLVYEFGDWDKLYRFVSDATQSPTHPILVQSPYLLSELLFFDQNAKTQSAISPRLKYWAQGSRKSHFSLHKKYQIENENLPYWLLTESGLSSVPGPCQFAETLLKNPLEAKTYSLYRCNF